MPQAIQLTLFGPEQPQQMELRLDPRDLHDEAFWAEAEARVVEALRAYARRAGNGRHVSRRLFAEDALQDIAFVDLLQRPFDVVLMNPPFGAASVGSKEYIKHAYPRTKNDLSPLSWSGGWSCYEGGLSGRHHQPHRILPDRPGRPGLQRARYGDGRDGGVCFEQIGH